MTRELGISNLESVLKMKIVLGKLPPASQKSKSQILTY